MMCSFCQKADVPYDDRLGIHGDYRCLRCEGLLRKIKKQSRNISERAPQEGMMFTCFSNGSCEARYQRKPRVVKESERDE